MGTSIKWFCFHSLGRRFLTVYMFAQYHLIRQKFEQTGKSQGGRGESTKFYTGRLTLVDQPLILITCHFRQKMVTLLYTFYWQKGTPFTLWNPFPFIYLKPKKGTPFGWSLSMSAIIGSTPSPQGESHGYTVVCHGNRKLKMCGCREPVLTLVPR